MSALRKQGISVVNIAKELGCHKSTIYQEFERNSQCLFYFATPYQSWEQGTNENTNGLIRQYLPKKASVAHVTQRLCSV